jgi:hypothetical protein
VHAVENAYRMLVAGVTTVQSLGGGEDAAVRSAAERHAMPLPRILTSLGSMSAGTGGPAELREAVRRFAADGADVIKIFASESIRTGGARAQVDGLALGVSGGEEQRNGEQRPGRQEGVSHGVGFGVVVPILCHRIGPDCLITTMPCPDGYR